MITISQGVLKRVRDEMFEHMQSLPIKYFDTHTHGDIMSYYTNDADTLRQMISQSIPQVFNSIITIVAVFCGMLYTSWYLTIVVILFVIVQMLVVKNVGGKSGKYFVGQQQSLGKVNGYIEEMITGQKVVKVFCHEEEAKEEGRPLALIGIGPSPTVDVRIVVGVRVRIHNVDDDRLRRLLRRLLCSPLGRAAMRTIAGEKRKT